jgi:ureidoacrylate peracid hydrolase
MTNQFDARCAQISALPEPITIDLAHTAVLVIDMQNDFGAKGGMFDKAGVDIREVREVIGPTRKVLRVARDAGIKIIYLKMGFRSDLSDLGDDESPNRLRHIRFGVGQPSLAPDGREGRFLIRDTWNTDILDELRPEPGDIVVYKHRFSGFYQTNLDEILRSLQIRNLIVTGCTTAICVDSIIRDAMFRDYRCVLLADCSGEPIGSSFERSNHDATLLTVQVLFGWVAQSVQIVAAIESLKETAQN